MLVIPPWLTKRGAEQFGIHRQSQLQPLKQVGYQFLFSISSLTSDKQEPRRSLEKFRDQRFDAVEDKQMAMPRSSTAGEAVAGLAMIIQPIENVVMA